MRGPLTVGLAALVLVAGCVSPRNPRRPRRTPQVPAPTPWSRDIPSSIPRIVDDLARGSGTLAAAVLLDDGPPPGFAGWGLTYGVFCSELAGPPVELLAGGRALFPELPAPVLSLVPSRRSPSRTAPGGPPRRPRRRARAAVERRPGAGDGRGVRRRHRATAPGFQRSVYFHPPTGTSIVVLTNLLLAPNTYFPEALPAERITQLVQQAVIEG